MTREEAIEELKYIQWYYNGFEEEVEALDMAIEALSTDEIAKERQNIYKLAFVDGYKKAMYVCADYYDMDGDDEASIDLISRADAIKAICNAQCELDVPHYPQCDQVKWCDEVNALLALPSVERLNCEDCEYRMMWKERADDE